MVLSSLSRIYIGKWLGLRLTGGGSSPAMAARRRVTMVRQPALAMAGLGERFYGTTVLRRTIRTNLGLGDALGTPGHGEVHAVAELTPMKLTRRRRPDGSG